MAEAQSESNHDGVAEQEGENKSLAPTPMTQRFSWVLYQGCWLRPSAVESVKLVQKHFVPRHDDVFVATYPKCGTTWLKALAFAITHRSRHGSDADNSHHPLLTRHPQDLVPFLEMPYRQLHPISDLEALPSPRLLCTHLPLPLLPQSVCTLGCRVIYLCREPKDVLVSLCCFINKVKADYTMDKAFELFCEGVSSFGPIWDHNLGFWKKSVSDPGSVLFLKYEEMMAQPVKHVKMLAEFIGVPFTDEEVSQGAVEGIVNLCSFEKLKSLPVNSSGVSDWIGGIPTENSSFFRAGKVGDWKNHLTEEMAKKLDDIVEEKIKGSGLKF